MKGEKERPVSYYGRPVVKAPVWSPVDIGGYLFLGGLAGASSVLAAGAELTARPGLARAGKIAALGAISASAAALVHDLGRPGRFVNMLRVVKPTSPMSVGSWLLAGYGPAAGVAAATAVTGILPGVGRAATIGAGLLGPAVASYTAVLISDTATPAWHNGYREMPFVFVGSAATAAAGLGMIAASPAEAGPARRAAVFGTALETLAMHRMRSRLGMIAETHHEGKAGTLLKAAEVLTIGGAITGALLGRRSRIAATVAGAALLAGSACTRLGLFQAGVQSAEDPKYTVTPQKS
ncbi:NrfD/PsrC family molybdoenzyme membrane anchor subunit [Kutzneria chonburiensis]|uniref:NrfD/PsrC family molybdoenzyme membrane anchor subunit n=1 Tax=Kutzneria chonburiensis TaxID=1483604 RepID=A0ABV6MRZ3_9PSEU|nr:NrfD/PsrC family molybdoenzyme membrane anchor subunit [Kutzneria chonburiensis]